MFRLFFLLLLMALAVMFTGCRNDLELNAPYKEIPSIYAVLNPADTRHEIRINKVFLGEGDANQMAQVADSVNYPQGELKVTLRHFEYGELKEEIPFYDTVVVITAPGAFSREQRLWVSYAPLKTSGEYRLEVVNNRTGNVFTATTTAFPPVKSSGFPPLSEPYYPYAPDTDPNLYIDYSQNGGSVRFNPNQAKVYQLVIRTHFYDLMNPDDSKRYDFIDFNFTTQEERNKQVQGKTEWLVSTFRTADYFHAAGIALQRKNLPEINVAGRKVYKIEYLIHSSTQDYIDYLQYSSPSFAITQTTPIYSNFANKAAIGIFTFRTTFSVEKEPASTMINEFARNPNTCNYRFFNSDMVVGNCQP